MLDAASAHSNSEFFREPSGLHISHRATLPVWRKSDEDLLCRASYLALVLVIGVSVIGRPLPASAAGDETPAGAQHRGLAINARPLTQLLGLTDIGVRTLSSGGRLEQATGQICGIVMDAAGKPLPHQRVELHRPRAQGRGHVVVTTDAKGAFSYTGLRSGRYEVEWISDGLTVVRSGPIELSPETRQITSVTLVRPLPPPQEVGPGVARSVEQLQLLVQPGDRVAVVDTGGTQVTGRIAEMMPSLLSLLDGGNRRDFREGDVMTIRQRRGDPLGNGALAGLGVGASMGAVGMLLACTTIDCSGSWAAVPIVIGLYGAMGAGVGVAIDAAVRHEQVIYSRRQAGTSAGVTLVPLLERERMGLLARVQF